MGWVIDWVLPERMICFSDSGKIGGKYKCPLVVCIKSLNRSDFLSGERKSEKKMTRKKKMRGKIVTSDDCFL